MGALGQQTQLLLQTLLPCDSHFCPSLPLFTPLASVIPTPLSVALSSPKSLLQWLPGPHTTHPYPRLPSWSETDLPYRVRVLARLGRAAEDGLGVGLLEVVNGHVAVIVAHHHQVGVVHVHVETHDAALAAEGVFREAGVLHAVEQQHAPALLHEVICPGEDGPLRLGHPAALPGSPCAPSPPDGQALPCSASPESGLLLWLHLLCL